MYAAKVQPVLQHSPWNHVTFDQRLALMMRGSPRAAYFYSVPDTSTFRYRVYNVVQTLAAPVSQEVPPPVGLRIAISTKSTVY